MLLAVDLGLTGGYAFYDRHGRLLVARSFHCPNRASLKRLAHDVVHRESIGHVFLEGDRGLGLAFERQALKKNCRVTYVPAETWRPHFIVARERRSGAAAKKAAQTIARRVVQARAVRKPKSLRIDAAEAILIGLFGCLTLGWGPDDFSQTEILRIGQGSD